MWLYIVFLGVIIGLTSARMNEITEANFNSLIQNSNNMWILEFYSPNCPYCKDFAPEYDQVASTLEGTSIKVGRVDGVHNSGLAERFNVHGFPTVKMFKPDSKPEEYAGPRTAASIVETAKALVQEKHIRSFGDAFINLPQVFIILTVILLILY